MEVLPAICSDQSTSTLRVVAVVRGPVKHTMPRQVMGMGCAYLRHLTEPRVRCGWHLSLATDENRGLAKVTAMGGASFELSVVCCSRRSWL